ncbi:hypothetical protein VTN77DRAFT_7488 [Rasamsonia byssochlamydoides]|uniref:uncharacterized protein n=1 Tax=Rasamsonia byssochlamydoides TaxID=89139 RepID=UPI003743BB6E
MFRNRRTSQKPDEELIDKFKKTFPDVVSGASCAGGAGNSYTVDPAAVESVMQGRSGADSEDIKLHNPTPQAIEDFRFTPFLMDPTSFSFMSLTNQPPDCYTPTVGGMTTIYDHQAGDLHTPTLGSNLVTPLSIPNSLSGDLPIDPNADVNVYGFDNQFLPQQFQNLNPFAQQVSYAPSTFVHRDSGYDPMDRSGEVSSMDPLKMQETQPLNLIVSTVGLSEHMDVSSVMNSEKFRYAVTLRAPTAMIKHPDEIPVTYLNKGQAYSISVVDTAPPQDNTQPLMYRTYIRVSFDDEQQRSKPAACWQLWKEGRGSSEAHQRGGKLLAVEYVDPIQGGDDEHRHRQVELESASFDGFCVTWTPNPTTGASDCAISVRFNFLSTDFSHSKGVKGIPVRLCAKTELLSPRDGNSGAQNPEICYCKVKLFRDHGAERKLANDIAHVKKTMEKLKQQIAQLEMAGGSLSKRKRSSGSIAIKSSDNRPVKVLKNKRTWSIDSQNDGSRKLSVEEDLHLKLAMVQDMFSSTRPVSILSLRGDEHDDPDLYPVTLPGDLPESLSRQRNRESVPSIDAVSGATNTLSPTNSSVSSSPGHPVERQPSNHQHLQRDDSVDWSGAAVHHSLLNQPVKVQKLPRDGTSVSSGYIEAIDIDPTYRPPAEHPPKPIACFYIRFPSDHSGDDYYRAVYLTERTVKDLMNKILEKHKIDPDRIVRVLRINHDGLKIMVDDDVVRELPEGQDMVVEFSEATKAEVDTPSPAVEVILR